MNVKPSHAWTVSRSICCAAIAASLVGTGMSSAENSARFLKFVNCSASTVNDLRLQLKTERDGWVTKFKEQGLSSGQAVCFDLKNMNAFSTGDRARFRAIIGWGDKTNCDDTNVDASSDQMRVMKIKGTSLQNNGCRSVGYRARDMRCSEQGSRTRWNC